MKNLPIVINASF